MIARPTIVVYSARVLEPTATGCSTSGECTGARGGWRSTRARRVQRALAELHAQRLALAVADDDEVPLRPWRELHERLRDVVLLPHPMTADRHDDVAADRVAAVL